LAAQININMQSNIRNTALILAAENGHTDIAQLLMQASTVE